MRIKSNIMIMLILGMMIVSVSAFNPKTTSMMMDEIDTPENMEIINNILENPRMINQFLVSEDLIDVIESEDAVHLNISDGNGNAHYYFMKGDNRMRTDEITGVEYLEVRTDSSYVRFAYDNQERIRKYLEDGKISMFEVIKLKLRYMKYE